MYVWRSDEVFKNFKLFCGAIFLGTTYFFKVNPFNAFLEISYFAGQILVNKFLDVYSFFREFLSSTSVLLQIVHEDGLVFLKDVAEKILFVTAILQNVYAFLERVAETCWIYAVGAFERFCEVVGLVYECITFIHFTITAIKQLLSSIGSFTWNSIAQLPETAINVLKSVVEFVKNTNSEIKSLTLFFLDSLQQFFYTLFYIPLNSLYGLLISAILVLVFCLNFKAMCSCVWKAISKFYCVAATIAESVYTGRFLDSKSHTHNPEENNEGNLDERLCVICQFSLKEVILFPCRHLCLCWECSVALSKVQHTCPICRSYIRDTLKVYL